MSAPHAKPAFDEAKCSAFVDQVILDQGAAYSMLLMAIGDRLGLYRALSARGPMTPTELATETGTTERYVREWLINQAAGGIVTYDADSGRYTLPPEHAAP